MAKIILVEDDQSLGLMIKRWLSKENHVVEWALLGKEALERVRLYHYDLMILDWELPDISGLEVCKQLRQDADDLCILMLTGKSALEDKTSGLDSGVDDYLTKPFHTEELSSRIRAILRRPRMMKPVLLEAGSISLDPASGMVMRGDEAVQLAPKEYALLEFFLRHPNEVFTVERLLNTVWSSESDTVPESIRPYINRLRSKLDIPGKPSFIKSVYGLGYRFEPGAPEQD